MSASQTPLTVRVSSPRCSLTQLWKVLTAAMVPLPYTPSTSEAFSSPTLLSISCTEAISARVEDASIVPVPGAWVLPGAGVAVAVGGMGVAVACCWLCHHST